MKLLHYLPWVCLLFSAHMLSSVSWDFEEIVMAAFKTTLWYLPGPANPQSTEAWEFHKIAESDEGHGGVAIADLDNDGDLDVAWGNAWYENPGDREGKWHKNLVVEGWEGLHSLQLADFDRDGDQDILTAEMHTRGKHRVAILENVNIGQNQWKIHVLSTTGSHKATAADLNGDGYPDVIGKNFEEDIRPRIWLNPNGIQGN